MTVLNGFARILLILATAHENISKTMSYLELILQRNFQVTLDFTLLIFKYSSGLWGAVLEQHLPGSSSYHTSGESFGKIQEIYF